MCCYESFKLPTRKPRERMFAILFLIIRSTPVLGPVRTGRRLAEPVHRPLCRSRRRAGSLFQSINPIYIILLAPLFATLWQWLGRKGKEPSAPAKFGLALMQMGRPSSCWSGARGLPASRR
jgi:proton-dependent oligopeptide transporter, POT family